MPALLITGPPGSGKTTVIRKVLPNIQGQVSGFYTQEIREQGRRTGFRLITLDGQEGVLAHVDCKGPPSVGKYGLDLAVLEGLGVTSLAAEADLVVIDEIGPMEIRSERFKESVLELLRTNQFVLGTIARHRIPYLDSIRSHPNVEVLNLRRENQEGVIEKVLDWLREVESRS